MRFTEVGSTVNPSRRTSRPNRDETPGHNTNLASEFHVLSVLYRLGLNANLTLGNKKGVDIVVARAAGDAATIDVKAVVGKTDWITSTAPSEPRVRHFVVLVSYEGKFKNLNVVPRAWVLPHPEFLSLVRTSSTGWHYISRREVTSERSSYEDAWDLIAQPL